MSVKVTTEDVARVAELAHLKLTSDETGSMVQDLNAMLEYVAQLNELDTNSVAPLAQVSELEGAFGAGSLREDGVKPSISRAAVTSQAPETDGVFFKVPKVIER
jgi:aspartyl-tRNA(Asn)/glutamyl-tRNA(Gln) amidotransferase subunit C